MPTPHDAAPEGSDAWRVGSLLSALDVRGIWCDAVVLSERGDGPGTHWVCRCHGVWHDPLGSSGAAQRVQFERRVQGRWTDQDIEQPDDNSCGQRCLAALMTGRQLGEQAFLLL